MLIDRLLLRTEFRPKIHRLLSGTTSTWEASEAFELDHNSNVKAWVKNDHLGYEILYIYQGVVRKYRPDFIIRLKTGSYLVFETKGRDSDQDRTKRAFLDEWVKAVNEHGGFGHWSWAVSLEPSDIKMIIAEACSPSLYRFIGRSRYCDRRSPECAD